MATLYIVFAFDSSENELAMLDLIQGNVSKSLANCSCCNRPFSRKVLEFSIYRPYYQVNLGKVLFENSVPDIF
jgi:hypothetical protein